MNEEVSLLIPTRFGSRFHLDLCLRTIRKYTTMPHRFIVGDAGVDDETRNFLDEQRDVNVVPCPDPLRPKDWLVRQTSTPYFMLLHDDIQILRRGWVDRRLDLMKRKPRLGVVGPLTVNYRERPWWLRLTPSGCLSRRFMPLAMLVRKETQDSLDLCWGKVGAGSFDTGAVAYLQILRQRRWTFCPYTASPDIRHWNCKTWAVRKREIDHDGSEYIERQLAIREHNTLAIRKILDEGRY